ncbi:uncharacterized protein LOC126839772 [Adelges cooleyi]|uniref:uncharacterized protein LOC126837647 n=1 Tax=Adelges cooleyi TaxID=133065 RepID=UPI00217FB6CB|nr:uncharacterized protein LOC126837647 [Adelges cooleyi]XP_050431137.1 uncharacterized protein LOC126839772 [Adelges cooleyi]
MAFKFAILLLSSVIINNSVSQPSTREVLSKAFGIAYDCYKYDVPGSDDPTILDKSDFLDFVGEFSYNSVSLEAPDYISFDDFSELVPLICKKQDIDINDFLKERIAAADVI